MNEHQGCHQTAARRPTGPQTVKSVKLMTAVITGYELYALRQRYVKVKRWTPFVT